MSQIFISGLPYTSSEQEVSSLFEDCGEILSIKLPHYQDTNRLLGYGHITFKDPSSVDLALQKDKIQLGSRYIEVKKAQGVVQRPQNTENAPEECLTIFVKNLSYDLTADQIGDAFRPCGKIRNVRMVYNHQSAKFKGFAFIDFEQHISVKKALEMNGKKVHGREVKVDFDTGAPKASFKFSKDQLETQKKYNLDVQILKKKQIRKEKVKGKVTKIKNFAEEQKKKSALRNKEQL